MKITETFPIQLNWPVWLLSRVTPPGLPEPLQGYVVAGGVGTKLAGREQTFFLVVEQQGRIAPTWVAEDEVVRCEVQKGAADGAGRFSKR